MKKKLIAFVCFLLVSLSGLPQLPVRLNERPVVFEVFTDPAEDERAMKEYYQTK